MSTKVFLKFNITGITPTWNASTLGSKWGQELWMTFLDSHRLLWPGTASYPLYKDHSGPTEVLTFLRLYHGLEIPPTLTDLCHMSCGFYSRTWRRRPKKRKKWHLCCSRNKIVHCLYVCVSTKPPGFIHYLLFKVRLQFFITIPLFYIIRSPAYWRPPNPFKCKDNTINNKEKYEK